MRGREGPCPLGHLLSFIPGWQVVRAGLLSCEGPAAARWENKEPLGDSPMETSFLFSSSLPSPSLPSQMFEGFSYFRFQSRKEIVKRGFKSYFLLTAGI